MTKRNEILTESVKRFLRRNAEENLLNLLEKVRSPDLAHLCAALSPSEGRRLFHLLAQRQPDRAADVLPRLEEGLAQEILGSLEEDLLADLLRRVSPDDGILLLDYLPEERVEAVLQAMNVQGAYKLRNLMQYEAETAGRIMTPNFYALREEVTVEAAIERIRTATEMEMILYLYVVDDRNHLLGVVSMRKLLTAAPTTPLREIMIPEVIRVQTGDDQEHVARLVSTYDLLAVPVVDDQHRLVGIVTVDDVIDVLKEEATEDFFKLAGTHHEERLGPTPFKSARYRVLWLLASFLGALAACGLLSRFPVERAPVFLSFLFFIPAILLMGETMGAQASTVVVRGLATGRLDLKHMGQVFLKELGTAMILGTFFGGLLLGVAGWLGWLPWKAALVTSLSLVAAMTLAAVIGSALPMVLKRCNVDPAIATGPLIATTVDLLGILVYLGLATHFYA